MAFDADAKRVTVRASDATGFDVSLRVVEPRKFVVSYEGWFETFGRAEDAYDCFEYGLSDSCRLRMTFRGATPVAWQIEKRDYGVWMPRPRRTAALGALLAAGTNRAPAESGLHDLRNCGLPWISGLWM